MFDKVVFIESQFIKKKSATEVCLLRAGLCSVDDLNESHSKLVFWHVASETVVLVYYL